MGRRRCAAFVATFVMVAAGGRATADTENEPLVTPISGSEAHFTLAVSVGRGTAFEPVVIAPDVFYGAIEGIALGLTHSSRAQTGFSTGSLGGFCVTGSAGGCQKLYAGPGVTARFRLLAGSVEVAADAGFIAVSVASPSAAAFRLGLIARARFGRVTIHAAPNVWVGLSSRTVDGASFNRERLHLPVRGSVRVWGGLELALESGARGPLDDVSSDIDVPLTLIGDIGVTRTMRMGLSFGFDNLAGTNGTTDGRTISVFASSAL